MPHPGCLTRRDLLARAGCGFGLVALADLLAAEPAGPYAARAPHFAPRAKRCIFLYMPGGPSHIDLFDPKPRVAREHGKPLPFEKPRLERTKTGNLFGSPWRFARHGRSGVEMSELWAHLPRHADDL